MRYTGGSRPLSCLQAFRQGIAAAMQQQLSGADALVLGAGGGLLSLLAAQAGAGSVIAVERSRMLYRMAKQCLEANAAGQHAELAARVQLLDRPLQAVGFAGEGEPLPPDALLAAEQQQQQQRHHQEQQQQQGGSTAQTVQERQDNGKGLSAGGADAAPTRSALEAAVLLPRRPSVLVTDLLDHSVLGMGLLPAVDYAAERLLAPGALVVPQRIQVRRAGRGPVWSLSWAHLEQPWAACWE